jgi:hypothetical protein
MLPTVGVVTKFTMPAAKRPDPLTTHDQADHDVTPSSCSSIVQILPRQTTLLSGEPLGLTRSSPPLWTIRVDGSAKACSLRQWESSVQPGKAVQLLHYATKTYARGPVFSFHQSTPDHPSKPRGCSGPPDRCTTRARSERSYIYWTPPARPGQWGLTPILTRHVGAYQGRSRATENGALRTPLTCSAFDSSTYFPVVRSTLDGGSVKRQEEVLLRTRKDWKSGLAGVAVLVLDTILWVNELVWEPIVWVLLVVGLGLFFWGMRNAPPA